jgi:hypothetical protein
MSQLLIITGMHRSGTSLITSILQQSGLPIGEELLPAAHDNPRGFFEDQAFMLLHQAMLHARGVTNLVNRGFTTVPNDAEMAQASMLISERSAQPLWGWKDPRTALFLDFWNGLLPDAGYLFIYRNPLDVLLSLMRRNEPYMAGLLEGLEAWYAYNLRLLTFAAAHPERCILCSVGGVLASSKRLRDLLTDRIGIQLALTDETRSALYRPDELRQAPATLADIAELAAIHPEAVALYRDLEQRADIAEARNPAWHDRYALPSRPDSAALRRARLIMLCAKLDPATTEQFFARGDHDINTLQHHVQAAYAHASRMEREALRAQAALREAALYTQSLEAALARIETIPPAEGVNL